MLLHKLQGDLANHGGHFHLVLSIQGNSIMGNYLPCYKVLNIRYIAPLLGGCSLQVSTNEFFRTLSHCLIFCLVMRTTAMAGTKRSEKQLNKRAVSKQQIAFSYGWSVPQLQLVLVSTGQSKHTLKLKIIIHPFTVQGATCKHRMVLLFKRRNSTLKV